MVYVGPWCRELSLHHEIALCHHELRPSRRTHPPRKAPTGFLTGAATTSCLNAALVWKVRAATAGALVAVRRAGRRMWEAIVILRFLRLRVVFRCSVSRSRRYSGFVVWSAVVRLVVCLTWCRCLLELSPQSSLTEAAPDLIRTLARLHNVQH